MSSDPQITLSGSYPPYPIIDSHIHLWPSSHLPTLAWHSATNPLGSQYTIDEYRLATNTPRRRRLSVSTNSTDPNSSPRPNLIGFVYLETDRVSGLTPETWTHVLDEVAYLARIALDTPLPNGNEGHQAPDSELCLAIVPWAPVPAGPEVLVPYMEAVRERVGEKVWRRITGVRYLVQDKARGTMLADAFVEGVKWLETHGLVFDLGIDARSGGVWQLEEAVELCKRVNAAETAGKRTRIVINHLCKPNLRLGTDALVSHPEFNAWANAIDALASCPNTVMKLSGGFSELPPQPDPEEAEIPIEHLALNVLKPWTDVVFDKFGPERILFASDWPVCEVGGKGQRSWAAWVRIVKLLIEDRGLGEDDARRIWAGNARDVYRIEEGA